MTSSRSLCLWSITAVFVIIAAGLVRLGSSAPTPLAPFSTTSQAAQSDPVAASPTSQTVLLANYGQIPLSFEPNRGQTDSRVKFLSRGPGYMLFLTSDEAVLKLEAPPSIDRRGAVAQTMAAAPDTFHMKLVGANPNSKTTALNALPGKSNYFIGNDPKLWRTNIPNYSRVQYRE